MTTKSSRRKTRILILRKSGYVARISSMVDGVRFRRSIPLNTEIKAIAKIKLQELQRDKQKAKS